MANGNFRGIGGKIAGLAVKGKIRRVEEQMARGMVISAAASHPQEQQRLDQIKKENQIRAQNATRG